jgi:hypothetical protein
MSFLALALLPAQIFRTVAYSGGASLPFKVVVELSAPTCACSVRRGGSRWGRYTHPTVVAVRQLLKQRLRLSSELFHCPTQLLYLHVCRHGQNLQSLINQLQGILSITATKSSHSLRVLGFSQIYWMRSLVTTSALARGLCAGFCVAKGHLHASSDLVV